MQRPRLLSDNGSSYVSGDLAKWLERQDMRHTRGAPYHPMTQGKIERWHQTLKNRILLENFIICPAISKLRSMYSSRITTTGAVTRGIDNLTPADVYFGRSQTILLERERIKRKTIQNCRLEPVPEIWTVRSMEFLPDSGHAMACKSRETMSRHAPKWSPASNRRWRLPPSRAIGHGAACRAVRRPP